MITADDGKTATLAMHEHQWTVERDTANANVLKERCTVSGCSTTTGGRLTLNANDKDYGAVLYAAEFTAQGWHSSTENYVIKYERKNADGSLRLLPVRPPRGATTAPASPWTA